MAAIHGPSQRRPTPSASLGLWTVKMAVSLRRPRPTVLKLRRRLFAAVSHSASMQVKRLEEIRVRSRLCTLVRPVGSQLGCQTNRSNF
jgi:hypothetical protein